VLQETVQHLEKYIFSNLNTSVGTLEDSASWFASRYGEADVLFLYYLDSMRPDFEALKACAGSNTSFILVGHSTDGLSDVMF
jgi:hypothetical protein